MNKSIALAADASPLAAFLAPVLMSDPSRMLIPILTRALPSERLGRDDRLYSFESPYLVLRDAPKICLEVRHDSASITAGW